MPICMLEEEEEEARGAREEEEVQPHGRVGRGMLSEFPSLLEPSRWNGPNDWVDEVDSVPNQHLPLPLLLLLLGDLLVLIR